MKSQNRTYIAIDLKSFYASVECIERGLNPMTTNLVVADACRTEKTICLAVSPSLKAYDIQNLQDPDLRKSYHGEVTTDHYGRAIPKHAHGTGNLGKHTSSTKLIMKAVMELFDRIVDKKLLIRRINITANHVIDEASMPKPAAFEQLDLFTDYEAVRERQAEEEAELQREKKMQSAMLAIKKKFGKNAILKGTNLEEGATTIDRNNQIGGHKA